MEKMLLSATSNRDTQVPMVVQNDLKMELLQTQLKLMPQLISRHREITGITIKKVTNIRTLYYIMNANPAAKSMCSEIHSLLKLYNHTGHNSYSRKDILNNEKNKNILTFYHDPRKAKPCVYAQCTQIKS